MVKKLKHGMFSATRLLLLFVFFVIAGLSGCGRHGGIYPGEDGAFDTEINEQRVLQFYGEGPGGPLYSQAKQFYEQGKIGQAELSMERALRIEPDNAAYWYVMGKIKLRQNNPDEAVQFCLKSKSLSGRNESLLILNDRIIRQTGAEKLR